MSGPRPSNGPADILVVEDDEDIAELVQLFLLDCGHAVRLASNGEQGLALLNDRLPDLVITDVEMPLLTGPGMAARMLVEDLGRENIPIVILSGSERLSATAGRVGTPYYLAKPCSPGDLLMLVQRALRERVAPRPSP